MFATVEEVTKFLNESTKRRKIVAEALGQKEVVRWRRCVELVLLSDI